MCFLDRVREAARWAEDQWNGLSPSARDRILAALDTAMDPSFYINLAREEIDARLRELESRITGYTRHPERLRTEFIDYMLPNTRYGELARLLSPGSEPIDGFGEEISRPIILIPGMVGTRLFRTGPGSTTPSSTLPPDELANWLEQQLRSDDSVLLRDLPASVRDVLGPALRRISERRIYDPNAIWDPDSLHSMVHLMNKTATERGTLFCPDDTPAEPATDFAPSVADQMTMRGLFSLWYGEGAERVLRELATSLDVAVPDDILDDSRYEALRERRRARGWCHPVWDISKDWLLPLERTFGEVVYAFGYDWRQPLAHSVERLVNKIQRVTTHHGVTPILVTHSFGGLLARAAARQRPENVAGIVQVFSPTAGAVKMYTNFKKGGGGTVPAAWQLETPPEHTALEEFYNFDTLSNLGGFDAMSAGFALALGWDTNAFATISSGVYGIYSLLPNNIARYRPTGPWLNIENDSDLRSTVASSRNIYDLYRQFDRPWGLLDGRVWTGSSTVMTGDTSELAWSWLTANAGEAGSLVRWLHALQRDGWLRIFTREELTAAQATRVRERVTRGIAAAEEMNTLVGNYVHPNTWSMYSSGLDTDVGFNIRRTDSSDQPFATRRIIGTDGDASLEIPSARALTSNMHQEYHLPGVRHDNAMTSSEPARSLMIKSVYLAMVAAHRAS